MARWHVFFLSVVVVGAPSCKSGGHGTQPGAPATASASAAPSPSASAPARRLALLRRQGFAGLAFNSAGEIQLSDDQVSTLKKLEDDFEPFDRDARNAHEQFQTDLNEAVRAGKFDDATLRNDEAAIDRASLAAQAQEVDALDGLYAALDPDQRSALVAALRTREAAFQAQRLPAPGNAAAAASAARAKQTLDRMTRDLTLDADQQKKIASVLAKEGPGPGSGSPGNRDEMLKRLDAFLDAFDKPGFDAKGTDLSDSRLPHPAQTEVALLEKLAPILTPEQRQKLAAARTRAPPMHVPAPPQAPPAKP